MVTLTDTQHRILAALSRPVSGGDRYATPATNQEIADEVYLSVDAVKAHLRTLYGKFGIEDLAQNQKRARLVELAIEGGYLARAAVEEAPTAHNPLQWLNDKFHAYIEDRRREPRGDVLTELAQAKYEDGSTPDIDDVMNLSTFLFAAGTETTTKLVSSAMRVMAENP